MKKKILLAGAVALMAAAAVTGYTAHSKTGMVDLLSANVEALAQNEGTKVSSCYLEKMSGFPGWYQICDRETSPSMIFPCPENSTMASVSGISMCTDTK